MKRKNDNFLDERYFRTSAFPLAIFLYAKEFVLANIDRVSDERRAFFVFMNSPEVEEAVERFHIGSKNDPVVMVDARQLDLARQQLKSALAEDYFQAK